MCNPAKKSEIDLDELDKILKRFENKVGMAIPLLQAVQDKFRYIPKEAIAYIARNSCMSETQLYGVATFYSQFRLQPVGEKIIKVCHGTACHVGGAAGITQALQDRLNIRDGENTPDLKYTLTSVACVGCCSLAPVVMVDDQTYGRVERKTAVQIIDDLEKVK